MTYLLCRKGNYYYNRQVPAIYKDLDPRPKIRVALNTDSKRDARLMALLFNEQVESYWASLVTAEQRHSEISFGKVVHVARQMGFSYLPMSAVTALPLTDLVDRVIAIEHAQPAQVKAALGSNEEPGLSVDDALEKYWELARHKIIDKSVDQVRKWKNPRIKAVRNFVNVVGNKDVKTLTRTDTLAFRDWWIGRIDDNKVKPKTANKDFIHLKEVLKTVSKHFRLKLKTKHLFDEIMFPEYTEQTRQPFTSAQIIAMLNDERLKDMDEDSCCLIMAMAETGARNTEIIGLLPEDIFSDAEIPHISITGRKGKKLKTRHSKRLIPLTGYALDVFRARPQGFPRYVDCPDQLTNKTNKFLRDNGFFPSDNHSVYSMRHSFQDRLSEVDAPDRVQAELMGHRFSREKYGNGPSLEKKKEWMNKICLTRAI